MNLATQNSGWEWLTMKGATLTLAAALSVPIVACGGSRTEQLTASEKACADDWESISHAEMLRMKQDRSIDGIYEWSGGYWVSYDKIMEIC